MHYSLDSEIPTEPFWIEPAPGLYMLVRPLEMPVWEAAKSWAEEQAGGLAGAVAAIDVAGGRVVDLADLDDAHVQEGYGRFYFALGLARYGIVEWQGPTAGGEPAPVTDANIRELLRRGSLGDRFVAAYTAHLDRVRQEGEGCGTAPDGTTATVPNTAPGAEASDCPAAAARPAPTDGAAPMSSTDP